MPTDFATHAATITGLDAPPETLEEWWTTLVDQYAADDLAVGLGDLYSEVPTRHEVHVPDRVRYAHCVLDALLAAMIEPQATVTVRSIDPVSGTQVTVTVSDDSVAVAPETAVVCFGASFDTEDVEAAGSLAAWSVLADESEIRSSVCQYTNAFESEETFEQWAATTDSVAAPFPPAKVVPLLRKLPHEGKPSQ